MQITTGKSKCFKTVIARSGAGKTLLCYFETMMAKKPALIIDTYEQLNHSLEMGIEELVEAFNDDDFKDSFYKYKKKIVIRLGNHTLNGFFDLLTSSSKFHDLLVFVDEVDMNLTHSEVKSSDGFYKFLNRGRHKNFDLLTTCRNTANIPKTLIGQTDIFILTDLIEKGAINFVDNTLTGLNVSEDLQELEDYEFLYVDVNTKEKYKIKTSLDWVKEFDGL